MVEVNPYSKRHMLKVLHDDPRVQHMYELISEEVDVPWEELLEFAKKLPSMDTQIELPMIGTLDTQQAYKLLGKVHFRALTHGVLAIDSKNGFSFIFSDFNVSKGVEFVDGCLASAAVVAFFRDIQRYCQSLDKAKDILGDTSDEATSDS